MPSYKLTYFNARGRAELARLLFAQACVPYEDVRVEFADWPKLKPTMPFGVMPVLEIDGKVLSQSKAIYRYLGRQFGLCGKNELEAAFCDALVDGIDDLVNRAIGLAMERDPEKRKQGEKDLLENHIKPFLSRYEKFLTDNGTGYFVGNQLTWADLAIFVVLKNYCTDMLGGQPKLKEFYTKIGNCPKIKCWLERSPKTPF